MSTILVSLIGNGDGEGGGYWRKIKDEKIINILIPFEKYFLDTVSDMSHHEPPSPRYKIKIVDDCSLEISLRVICIDIFSRNEIDIALTSLATVSVLHVTILMMTHLYPEKHSRYWG
jgi:hypothetical protein